jgi:hypothetical protein
MQVHAGTCNLAFSGLRTQVLAFSVQEGSHFDWICVILAHISAKTGRFHANNRSQSQPVAGNRKLPFSSKRSRESCPAPANQPPGPVWDCACRADSIRLAASDGHAMQCRFLHFISSEPSELIYA